MIREHDDGVSLDVLVQPRASRARLGPVHGDQVEVLSGLDAGEQLITDPQAATRVVAGGR